MWVVVLPEGVNLLASWKYSNKVCAFQCSSREISLWLVVSLELNTSFGSSMQFMKSCFSYFSLLSYSAISSCFDEEHWSKSSYMFPRKWLITLDSNPAALNKPNLSFWTASSICSHLCSLLRTRESTSLEALSPKGPYSYRLSMNEDSLHPITIQVFHTACSSHFLWNWIFVFFLWVIFSY